MLKTSTIAACVLALSGSLALAQTASQYNGTGGVLPPPGGATNAPYGANGSAPLRDVGSPTANATDTARGGTQSTSILSQSNKNQSAAGMPSSNYGQPMAGPSQAQAYGRTAGMSRGGAYITDEYGNQYDERGNRIGHVRR